MISTMPRWSAVRDIRRRSPRNADFGRLLEAFLVAAVATILVIRTQLWLTNYPQLGGGGLHIAHLLYGGIFMVIAIGIPDAARALGAPAGGDHRRRRLRLLHRRAREPGARKQRRGC